MKTIYKIWKINLFLFISGIIAILGLYLYAALCPKLELKSANSFQIFDIQNNIVSEGSSKESWTNLEDISNYLIDATISVEDKNFYIHKGFDYLRIFKAMIINIKNKNIIQGASTISQQYVKNLYLDFGQTWKRKAEEAFLTMQLELDYDKNEILEGYLNTINYGQGNYGIKNASKYYFNKEPKDLTLEEAIILAGIPKSPSNYNPVSNYDKSIQRAKVVAKSMLNNNKIDKNTYNSLFKNEISLYKKLNDTDNDMILYYRDAVMEELKSLKEIPNILIDSGGLKIYTNLNRDIQSTLEESINKNIKDEKAQIASIIIDPKSGGVLAMSGGRNYAKSQYNRVTQAKRQVGSTMKPFLYYAALENNFVSSSTFTSEETTFSLANGKNYTVTNYGDKYANKPITMAAALALSDNIFAVKTNMYLGPETLVELAHRAGIEGNLLAIPSLALGTSELSMIDYAKGYTTFASGGEKKDIHFINKVEDLEGNILYEWKNKKDLVLNPNYVYILNEMMTNTTNSNFIDYAKPSALGIAGKLHHKYAIKTGTTGTDFYLVGYNKKILMLNWVGYDDGSEIALNENMYTKNIFADTVEQILKDEEDVWYEKPKNVIGIPKNAISGDEVKNNKNSAIYYYIKGTESYVFSEEKNRE